VKCHAPMAVLDGLTKDGLNLDQLPDQRRGVSCYFCHNAVSVEGEHNALVRVSNDDVMRGSIRDPIHSGAHRAEFSELFDHDSPRRSAMCGGCHDIVTPNGIHIERTFLEFKNSLFATSAVPGGASIESCPSCHMPSRQAPIAAFPLDAPEREVHEHLWPGIDVALTDFPNRDAMRSAIEDCQLGIGSVAFFALEVTQPNLFEFRVETNAYGAEFGRMSGGQINVITKAGSNALRGTVYEFHRNDALDARNYFDTGEKPEFTRNQFGVTLGGPLQRDRL